MPIADPTLKWGLALGGALLFLALGYFGVFTRIVFAINRRGGPAKIAGWLTATILALGWLGVTLELAGFFSIVVFPALVILVLVCLSVYVTVSR